MYVVAVSVVAGLPMESEDNACAVLSVAAQISGDSIAMAEISTCMLVRSFIMCDELNSN